MSERHQSMSAPERCPEVEHGTHRRCLKALGHVGRCNFEPAPTPGRCTFLGTSGPNPDGPWSPCRLDADHSGEHDFSPEFPNCVHEPGARCPQPEICREVTGFVCQHRFAGAKPGELAAQLERERCGFEPGAKCPSPNLCKSACRYLEDKAKRADQIADRRECSNDPPCGACAACELVQYDLTRSAVREALVTLSTCSGCDDLADQWIRNAEDLLRRALR